MVILLLIPIYSTHLVEHLTFTSLNWYDDVHACNTTTINSIILCVYAYLLLQNVLSLQEPYVSQDMLSLGYMRRVYCNNFQYNNDFTQGPRRQYSYEITDMVRN